MALNTNNMSLDDENAYYDSRNQSQQNFRDSIATPTGMADYNNQVAKRWSDIQNGVNGYEKESGFDKFMGNLVTTFVDNIPVIYAAALGLDGMGMFGAEASAGGGAAAAGESALGSAGADVGLGQMAVNTGALQDLGFLGGMTTGAGETAAGLGGLGGAAAAAIPDAGIVTIGAPAAAGGAGLGTAAGVGAAGLGLGALASGGGAVSAPPGSASTDNLAPDGSAIQGPMQTVTVGPPTAATGGVAGAAAGLGSAGATLGLGDLAPLGAVGALPYLDSIGKGTGTGSTTPGGTPSTGSGLPSGLPTGSGNNNDLSGLLSGLGSLFGAYNDHKNNADDTAFYKDQYDRMTGMYAPGTPEATLMEQKMNAQDAAAGRNSQYGTRAINLAGQLAQQRANIMTSPAYMHTADMYRGKIDNNMNSYLNALGQGLNGGGGLGSLFNTLGSGVNSLTGTSGGLLGALGSGLSSLFGNKPPTNGFAPSISGAVDNYLY